MSTAIIIYRRVHGIRPGWYNMSMFEEDSGSRAGDDSVRRRGLRYRLYAWLVSKWSAGIDHLTLERKRGLMANLRGTVVEVGPGTGANLRFYSSAVRWIGIEPNGHMDSYLRAEAKRLGREIEIRGGTAEAIPLPSGYADAVVATMVLCSVDDQARALQEIQRVLTPGGRFIFLEHVAAQQRSRLLCLQNTINPGWRIFADGCNVNRRTDEAIRRAGFRQVYIERFQVGQSFASPHIAGYALK